MDILSQNAEPAAVTTAGKNTEEGARTDIQAVEEIINPAGIYVVSSCPHQREMHIEIARVGDSSISTVAPHSEKILDDTVDGQESLRLTRRFESAHLTLSARDISAARPDSKISRGLMRNSSLKPSN